MKYDMAVPAPNAFVDWLQAELQRSQRGPVVVAGSVIAGEEAPVLEAFAADRTQMAQGVADTGAAKAGAIQRRPANRWRKRAGARSAEARFR